MNTQTHSPRKQYNRLSLNLALGILIWMACFVIGCFFITPEILTVVMTTGFVLIVVYSIRNILKSKKIECPKCGCKVGKGKFVRWRFWAKERCIECNYDWDKIS